MTITSINLYPYKLTQEKGKPSWSIAWKGSLYKVQLQEDFGASKCFVSIAMDLADFMKIPLIKAILEKVKGKKREDLAK